MVLIEAQHLIAYMAEVKSKLRINSSKQQKNESIQDI